MQWGEEDKKVLLEEKYREESIVGEFSNDILQKEVNILEVVGIEDDTYQIGFRKNKYIESDGHTIKVTDELKELIEEYFKDKGKKKITWNNTRTIFRG